MLWNKIFFNIDIFEWELDYINNKQYCETQDAAPFLKQVSLFRNMDSILKFYYINAATNKNAMWNSCWKNALKYKI